MTITWICLAMQKEDITAIFSNNIEHLLGKTKPNKIALAVSGGADSVTLLMLASSWARSSGVELTVLSVDHNLRPEAKEEVDYVRRLSSELGWNCTALSLDLGIKTSNLQSRAREGRYGLMHEVCKQRGIKELLTAHHFDDLIENYLIRYSRASSFLGLSNSHRYYYQDIRILRPLFNLRKYQLLTYLSSNNIRWYEDISNNSDKYQRNRIRKFLSNLDATKLQEIEAEIAEAERQAASLNVELIKSLAKVCSFNNYGFAFIDIKAFNNLSKALKVQILSYVITIISGNKSMPRYRNTNIILDKLSRNEPVHNSMHSCILQTTGDKLLIYREASHIKSEPILLSDKNIWDSRFEIIADQDRHKNLWLSKLTNEDYAKIKDKIDCSYLQLLSYNSHKKILFTLPVIKNLEKIIAIPHISYYDSEQLVQLKVLFRPNFVSRFTHFF